MTFTESERSYLGTQQLGRLATVAPDGAPQNNPVGYRYNAELETLDISGYSMGETRKFRNVQANPLVAFVVDRIVSTEPWEVQGIEVRGWAEALDDQDPAMAHMSRQIIRIHPRRVISWNVDVRQPGMYARNVEDPDPGARVA